MDAPTLNASARPRWIRPFLTVKPGRDPLGLMTITEDRITPGLLPGVLANSQRARYFSFYPFLLDEYERLKMSPSSSGLSRFIKQREFEFALAARLCPRGCGGSGAQGGNSARAALSRSHADGFARTESVDTHLGGYGLFYRSPLQALGVTATEGTVLGQGEDARPIPVDVLRRSERAQALAETFRAAIADTDYYSDKTLFRGVDPLSEDVLVQYSERACLCRLDEHPAERDAIHVALFEASEDVAPDDTTQRRNGFAVFLDAVDVSPRAAESEGAFREVLWQRLPQVAGTAAANPIAQWAALAVKEAMQEAFSCMWGQFCKDGLKLQAAQTDAGVGRAALLEWIRGDLATNTLDLFGEEWAITPDMPLSELRQVAATVLSPTGVENARRWARENRSVASGVVLLLAIEAAVPPVEDLPMGWRSVAIQGSKRQPGLHRLLELLRDHFLTEPTFAETVDWLVSDYVIDAHERIAYGKLPDFTFRFRWESGRLVFYALPSGHLEAASSRRSAIATISKDLGFWHQVDDEPALTKAGIAFRAEVLDG